MWCPILKLLTKPNQVPDKESQAKRVMGSLNLKNRVNVIVSTLTHTLFLYPEPVHNRAIKVNHWKLKSLKNNNI